MDEACAEGIGEEHYRLEGRSLALLHQHQRLHQHFTVLFPFLSKLICLVFDLNNSTKQAV